MDELVFDAIGDVLDRVAAVAPITPKARAVADSPKTATDSPKAAMSLRRPPAGFLRLAGSN